MEETGADRETEEVGTGEVERDVAAAVAAAMGEAAEAAVATGVEAALVVWKAAGEKKEVAMVLAWWEARMAADAMVVAWMVEVWAEEATGMEVDWREAAAMEAERDGSPDSPALPPPLS